MILCIERPASSYLHNYCPNYLRVYCNFYLFPNFWWPICLMIKISFYVDASWVQDKQEEARRRGKLCKLQIWESHQATGRPAGGKAWLLPGSDVIRLIGIKSLFERLDWANIQCFMNYLSYNREFEMEVPNRPSE